MGLIMVCPCCHIWTPDLSLAWDGIQFDRSPSCPCPSVIKCNMLSGRPPQYFDIWIAGLLTREFLSFGFFLYTKASTQLFSRLNEGKQQTKKFKQKTRLEKNHLQLCWWQIFITKDFPISYQNIAWRTLLHTSFFFLRLSLQFEL